MELVVPNKEQTLDGTFPFTECFWTHLCHILLLPPWRKLIDWEMYLVPHGWKREWRLKCRFSNSLLFLKVIERVSQNYVLPFWHIISLTKLAEEMKLFFYQFQFFTTVHFKAWVKICKSDTCQSVSKIKKKVQIEQFCDLISSVFSLTHFWI